MIPRPEDRSRVPADAPSAAEWARSVLDRLCRRCFWVRRSRLDEANACLRDTARELYRERARRRELEGALVDIAAAARAVDRGRRG